MRLYHSRALIEPLYHKASVNPLSSSYLIFTKNFEFSSQKAVPGSEIWTPQSPILNAVARQSVDYDSRIFRIDANGSVSAEIDLFAVGYCLILPKYYPRDQHVCSVPLGLRTGLFQSKYARL